MNPTPEPQTFTVEEAARILRIGRTAAYALARQWRTTGGRSGLPVLELGRTLRVPRAALTHLLAGSAATTSEHARDRAGHSPDTSTVEQGALWMIGPETPR